jgi:hypothetical protein
MGKTFSPGFDQARTGVFPDGRPALLEPDFSPAGRRPVLANAVME